MTYVRPPELDVLVLAVQSGKATEDERNQLATLLKSVCGNVAGMYVERRFWEDFIQDAVLKCWEAIRHFDPSRGNSVVFMMMVARNHYRHEVRNRVLAEKRLLEYAYHLNRLNRLPD